VPRFMAREMLRRIHDVKLLDILRKECHSDEDRLWMEGKNY